MHASDHDSLERTIDIEGERDVVASSGAEAASAAAHAVMRAYEHVPVVEHELHPHGKLCWRRRSWSGGPAYVSEGPDGTTFHAWGGMDWTVVCTDRLGRVVCATTRCSRQAAFDLASSWASASDLFCDPGPHPPVR